MCFHVCLVSYCHLMLKGWQKIPLNASCAQINMGGGSMHSRPPPLLLRPWPQHVKTKRGVQRHGHVTVHCPAGNLLQCERLRFVGYRGEQRSLTLPIAITTTVRSSESTAPPLGCHTQPDPSWLRRRLTPTETRPVEEAEEEGSLCFPVIRAAGKLSAGIRYVKQISQITSRGRTNLLRSGSPGCLHGAEEALTHTREASGGRHKCTFLYFSLLSFFIFGWVRQLILRQRLIFPSLPPTSGTATPGAKWRKKTASPAMALGKNTSMTSRRYSTSRKSSGRE